ncbi:hypothetical protein FACS1894126_1570 [Alphaproteobacteria bacterium]|nr:hypothetical protein FACS1894126_1570 [Alphaproteobacteria bacterium]
MANTATQASTTTPQAAGAPSGSSGVLGALTPALLILVAFYFLLMRPQQKREEKRRNMIDSLKRGNVVVTSGGIVGCVHKIMKDGEISLEVSGGVRIRVLKSAIAEILPKERELALENEDVEITSEFTDVEREGTQKNNAKKEKGVAPKKVQHGSKKSSG